jgi:virginiamycin B lyase
MSELRHLLELGAFDFEPPPAGWDRLLRRATRRRNLRRVMAVVVASAVAIAGVGLVLVAFRGAEHPQPAATVDSPSPQPTERGSAFEVAFGDGTVWALTCDSGCSGDRRDSTGSALRIDPASGEVLASVSLSNPSKIALGEDGVWVISFWDDTVTRIDPGTLQVVATIELELPFAVCESCPGPRDFLPFDLVVGEGAVWVDTARGVVARIDPATNEVAATITVPGDSTGELAVGGGSVWVTEDVLGLYRVDPATNQIRAEITVDDDEGRRLAVDQVVVGGDVLYAQGVWARRTTSSGHEEFVFADRGAAIARIDPASDQPTSQFPIGDQPRLMAFDSGALWLWDSGGTSLERVDPDTGSLTATVEAPASGYFIGVGERAGWAAMPDGSIRKVDLLTR